MLITASKTTKRACLKERAHVLVAALEVNECGERTWHKGGHRALACTFARAHRENRASACGRGSVASDCRWGGRGRRTPKGSNALVASGGRCTFTSSARCERNSARKGILFQIRSGCAGFPRARAAPSRGPRLYRIGLCSM